MEALHIGLFTYGVTIAFGMFVAAVIHLLALGLKKCSDGRPATSAAAAAPAAPSAAAGAPADLAPVAVALAVARHQHRPPTR